MENKDVKAVKPFDMYGTFTSGDTSALYIEIRTSPFEYPAFDGTVQKAPPQRFNLQTNTTYMIKTSRSVISISITGGTRAESTDGRNWKFTTDNYTSTGLMIVNA